MATKGYEISLLSLKNIFMNEFNKLVKNFLTQNSNKIPKHFT